MSHPGLAGSSDFRGLKLCEKRLRYWCSVPDSPTTPGIFVRHGTTGDGMSPKDHLNDQSEWIEAGATIVSCRYQFARMNTLTMGLQTGETFRISFEYYAHGRLYSGEFQSPVAIAQNERIELHYNPLHPEENSYSDGARSDSGRALISIGVAGSVVLSLIWFAVFRGCS